MVTHVEHQVSRNPDTIAFHGDDFVDLMDELHGEMQIAVDWVDGAFGEIEAGAIRFRPVRALRTTFSRLLQSQRIFHRPDTPHLLECGHVGTEHTFHHGRSTARRLLGGGT